MPSEIYLMTTCLWGRCDFIFKTNIKNKLCAYVCKDSPGPSLARAHVRAHVQ